MAKTLKYTGALGPVVTCGGIRFAKGAPVVVEEDALAEKLLAKGYFEEEAKPADDPAASKPGRVKPAPGKEE